MKKYIKHVILNASNRNKGSLSGLKRRGCTFIVLRETNAPKVQVYFSACSKGDTFKKKEGVINAFLSQPYLLSPGEIPRFLAEKVNELYTRSSFTSECIEPWMYSISLKVAE